MSEQEEYEQSSYGGALSEETEIMCSACVAVIQMSSIHPLRPKKNGKSRKKANSYYHFYFLTLKLLRMGKKQNVEWTWEQKSEQRKTKEHLLK